MSTRNPVLPRGWALYASLLLAAVKLTGLAGISWAVVALPVAGALLVYLVGSVVYAVATWAKRRSPWA